MKIDEHGVTISVRTVIRILIVLAVISLALAVVAFRAAYRELPPREDHILTVAIVIALVAVTSAIAWARYTLRRPK